VKGVNAFERALFFKVWRDSFLCANSNTSVGKALPARPGLMLLGIGRAGGVCISRGVKEPSGDFLLVGE
jgi:hypothetical protein